MNLTFYDGLGDTVYCNCYPRLPPAHSDAPALVSAPSFFVLTLKSAPSFSMRRLVACRSDDH